jgi:hypothetical protein
MRTSAGERDGRPSPTVSRAMRERGMITAALQVLVF